MMGDLCKDYEKGCFDVECFKEFMEIGDEMVSLLLNNMYKVLVLIVWFKKVDVISFDVNMIFEFVVVVDLVDLFIICFYNEYLGFLVKINVNIDKSVMVYIYLDVILDIFNYLVSNVVSYVFKFE